MTVAELGERMSGKEVGDWQVYEQVEPFGERRADYRAASICLVLYQTVAAMGGGKAKDMTLEDFLLTRANADPANKEVDLVAFGKLLGAKVVQREPE